MQELENKLLQDEINNISSEEWKSIYNDPNLRELFLKRVREGAVFSIDYIAPDFANILFTPEYVRYTLDVLKNTALEQFLKIFAASKEDLQYEYDDSASEILKYYDDNKEEIINLFLDNIKNFDEVSNIDFINAIVTGKNYSYAHIIKMDNPTPEIEQFIIEALDVTRQRIKTYSKRIEEACIDCDKASLLVDFYEKSDAIVKAALKDLGSGYFTPPSLFLRDYKDEIEVIKYKISEGYIYTIDNELITAHPEIEDYIIEGIKSGKISDFRVSECTNYPKIVAAAIESLDSIYSLGYKLDYEYSKLIPAIEKDPDLIMDAIIKKVEDDIEKSKSLLGTIAEIEDYQKFDWVIKRIVPLYTFEEIVDIFSGYSIPAIGHLLNEYSYYYNYSATKLPARFDLRRKYNEKILLSAIPLLDESQISADLNAAYFDSEILLEALVTRLAELRSDKLNELSYLFRDHLTPKIREIILRPDNPLNLTIQQIGNILFDESSDIDNKLIEEIVKSRPVIQDVEFEYLFTKIIVSLTDGTDLQTLSLLLNANVDMSRSAYQFLVHNMEYINNNAEYKDQIRQLLKEFILKRKEVPLELTKEFDEETRRESTYDVSSLSKAPYLFDTDTSEKPVDFKDFVFESIKNNQPVNFGIVYNLVKDDSLNYGLLEYDNFTYQTGRDFDIITKLLKMDAPDDKTCIDNWLKKVDINELFRVHPEIVEIMMLNERLFKKLMELTDGKDVTYRSFLLNALIYDYSPDFKEVVRQYVEKQIVNNHVNIDFLDLSVELVQLDNPVLEKLLTEEYFSKAIKFNWLDNDNPNMFVFLAVRNKKIYYDALLENIRNNKYILDDLLSMMDSFPELVDIYIEGIKNKEFYLPSSRIFRIHFNPEVVKALLKVNEDSIMAYVNFIENNNNYYGDVIEWVSEETFNILVEHAASYCKINKDIINELVKLYGYKALALLYDEKGADLLTQDLDTVKKFIEIFKRRTLDFKSIEAINDSIQQKLFAKNNPLVINLYANIMTAIQKGITKEQIEGIVILLCKKDNNGNYLYMTDSLVIDDAELNELYKVNKEEFVKRLIDLLSENQNKYISILNMITSNYIAEKRNELTRNEDIYRDTGVRFHYDQKQLYDAYFKYIRENNPESFILSILTGGYSVGYPGDKNLDELTVKYLYDPNSVQVDKDTLILIKKNIRSIKERLGELYFHQLSPYEIGEKYLENVRKIFDFEERRISIEDFTYINVEAVLNIIKDKDKYDFLIRLLDKYKFLDWGDIFESLIEELAFGDDDFDMFNIVNAFNTICEHEERLLKKSGEGEEINLTAFKLIKYCSIYSSVAHGYRILFGADDFGLIKRNDGPNMASANPQERLDYDADLMIKMVQTDEVTIPSFVKDNALSSGKKLRALVGCKGDPRNLTIGERTGACMRAYGVAHEFFTFANSDPRGFNIIFEDPQTGEFISRVTGFRNGNTVFLNELRYSTNKEAYSNDDVVEACFKVAEDLIELSKDSDMPIENVVISPHYVMESEKYECQTLSEQDISKDVFEGYRDVSNSAIVLATIGKDGIAAPLKLDGKNQPIYKSCRLPIREYTLANIDNDVKILIQRVDLLKEVIKRNDISYIKTVDYDFDILEREFVYAIIGQDFYVALDKDGNIIHNIAVMTNESEREYQAAIDRVEEVKENFNGKQDDEKTI